ncbi:MAG: T9SS type A sorting domain-containing protein [Bacteroidetes bacterium]|nr:T9SS type A sorting domain-containing protein [Bacteroidota bacterium]
MKKKLLFLLLTAIAFLSFVNTSFAQAGGVCYATLGTNDPAGGSLIMIDIATGVGTIVGPSGLPAIPSLAINSAGQLFATNIADPANLYSIDPATGMGTLIGSTGLFFPDALAFDANDVLYVMDSNNDLYTLNPATGAATLVVSVTATIRGMEFDPTTGILWGGEGGAPGTNDGIYTIDLATGTATLVGNTGLGSNTPALCFDVAGNLYGTMGGGNNPNNLISIDKTTGVGTIIGLIGFVAVAGMSSLPPPVSVDDSQAGIPTVYRLAQNFPNPFNPGTRITFNLPVDSKVSLKIFDVLGQEVANLITANLNAGIHEVDFDASGFKSGVYFYKIEANAIDGSAFTDVKKMLLLK